MLTGNPVLLDDIAAGSTSSRSQGFSGVQPNGLEYFTANDGVTGFELYATDGTPAGTRLVKDINPGSGSSNINSGAWFNGEYYFCATSTGAGCDLWRTDGTEAGTQVVVDRPDTVTLSSLEVVNNRLFFVTSFKNPNTQAYLFAYDGNSAYLVKDINQVFGDQNANPLYFTNVNGILYFTATDGVNGQALWRSDGTDAGTYMVTDLVGGTLDAGIRDLFNYNGTLLFSAGDGNAQDGFDRELWRSDGTAGGTYRVIDINPGSGDGFIGNMVEMDGIVYFSGDDGTGPELWRSDGTGGGTYKVKDISSASSGGQPGGLVNVNGTLFFSAYEHTHGWEIWKSDGTDANTVLVKDIEPGWTFDLQGSLTNVNGKLYFTNKDGSNGYDIWKTDGTDAGTVKVTDFKASYTTVPRYLTPIGNSLVFLATTATYGQEPWMLDITPNRPPVLGNQQMSMPENSGSGAVVGTVAASDPDNGQTLSFAITADSSGGGFAMDPVSGQITTTGSVPLDFETAATYTLTVQATDNDSPPLSSSATITIHLTDVNEAPTDEQLSSSSLSDHQPVGAIVGQLNTSDPDAGDSFTYSFVSGTNDNASFQIVGNQLKTKVATNAATKSSYTVLLRSTDSQGLTVDKSFTINVVPNQAPVLDSSASPVLTAINEDAANPAGTPVEALISGITDANPDAFRGVAIISATGTSTGAWQYSLNAGGTWSPLGQPTDSAARLLPANGQSLLRYIPNTNFNGQVQLTLRAWDRTQGVSGGTFDLSATASRGGNTAFSLAQDDAPLIVLPVNDAPVLNTTPSPKLNSIVEDASNPPGTLVSTLLVGAVSDVDANALRGIAVVSAGGQAVGHWQYSLNSGSTWLSLGNPSETAARLIPGAAKVRFIPNANYNGQVALVYRAWDQTEGTASAVWDLTGKYGGTHAFSSASETATLTVSPVNDAPVLNTALNPGLTPSAEDDFNPGGTLVGSLLAGAVSDADAGALRGIAITSAGAANGTWQFSLNNGKTWQAVGSVSSTAARLVPGAGLLRFVPKANFSGTVSINYRAWDQTQGTPGGTFNLTGNVGGTKAFSTAIETATQTITAVNDAPIINSSLFPTLNPIFEDATSPGGTPVANLVSGITDADAGAAKGIAVITAGSGNGQWQFTLDAGASWQPMGAVSEAAARLLPATTSTRVRFIPNADFNGSVSLFYRAWDQTAGTVGGQMSTSGQLGGTGTFSSGFTHATQAVTPVDDAPLLQNIGGSVGYTHDSSASVLLAGTATVSDVDSPDFDTGKLLVHITTTGTSGTNVLGIGGGFTVDTSTNDVWLGAIGSGTKIGVRTSSGIGTDLVITFNASATPSIAQQLVRAITFKTTGGAQASTTRAIQFSISDGDGKTSAVLTKTVNVN